MQLSPTTPTSRWRLLAAGMWPRQSIAAVGGKIAIAICLCLAAFSLWLRSGIQVFAIGFTPHDDQLFVKLASFLRLGVWLGPYDQLTLAKGVGYPLFILAAFEAGIPLKLAEQGLYLAAAALIARVVVRLSRSVWLGVLLFACLAFNPAPWSWHLARVIREGEYVGLSLLLVALAAGALLVRQEGRSTWTRFAVLAALGAVGALYWMTRQEGLWLVPTLAVLAVAACIEAWRTRHDSGRGALHQVGSLVAAAAVPTIAFAVVLGAVATKNYTKYGVFITNELESAPFRAAYGALSRITHEHWQRYIVFPDDAREKAYAVSAAARQLRPGLDGELGEVWSKGGCAQLKIERCNGVPAGWFVWALRDSVAAAGHYSSAARALAYYRWLAAEINQACDEGRIACLPARATMAPPFRWHYVSDAIANVPSLAEMMFNFDYTEIGSRPADGPQIWLHGFREMVGPLFEPAKPTALIGGTVRAKAGPIDLAIHDREGASYRADMKINPQTGSDAGVGDFELTTDCLRPTCELIVRWAGNERGFPVEGLAAGAAFVAADMELRINYMMPLHRSADRPEAVERRQQRQLEIMRAIGGVYAALAPLLGAVAALGVLLALATHRFIKTPHGVLALALACAAALMTRAALLAYIQATSFPAIIPPYVAPASPFLLTFVVLGLYLGVLGLRGLYARWRFRAA